MGGTTSKTRKLIVENDDPTSVIKVSEDVVDRLKGVSQTVRKEAPLPNVPAGGNYQPGPFYLYEPSLTALQLRQENVAQLKKNDEYWETRVRNLEKKHEKIKEVMDQEYKKAVDEMSGHESAEVKSLEVPCLDTKNAVMECYRNNPSEPMNCSKLVQAFQECVDLKRNCLLANRG